MRDAVHAVHRFRVQRGRHTVACPGHGAVPCGGIGQADRLHDPYPTPGGCGWGGVVHWRKWQGQVAPKHCTDVGSGVLATGTCLYLLCMHIGRDNFHGGEPRNSLGCQAGQLVKGLPSLGPCISASAPDRGLAARAGDPARPVVCSHGALHGKAFFPGRGGVGGLLRTVGLATCRSRLLPRSGSRAGCCACLPSS